MTKTSNAQAATRNSPPFRVTILGSGTGVPLPHRSAPGLVVEAGSTHLLLDSGSGAAYQLARAGFAYHTFDHLLYSHFAHPDHVNDLPELIFANKYFDPRRTRNLHVYGPPGMREFIHNVAELYPVLAILDYPISIHELTEHTLEIDPVTIITKPMDHQGNPCTGYRVEYNEKRVVYSGDTGYCANLIALAQHADVLVVECSFPDDYKTKGHLIPEEIADIASRAMVKKVVLTHLYPPCDSVDVVAEVRKGFHGEVIKAEDMLKIDI